MSDHENIESNQLTRQISKGTLPFLKINRPVIFSLLVFLVLTILFSLVIFQRYQLAKESRQKEAFEVLLQAKDKLQVALTHSFAATKMLALLIDKNGQMNNFDSVAPQVLETGTGIDAVQMVPGGIIKYIYPLKGNEKAIGYNILQDSARNKEAYKAIEQKSMYFGGPFELKQGGMGVVGRLPVFRQNKFWGFSAAVIKMPTLYRAAGIDSFGKNGYYFQLSKINPDTKKEEFFMPQHKELSHNYEVSVQVPNGEWKLSVYSAVNRRVIGDIGLQALLAFLLSVFASLLAYRVAIKPKKLKELVLNRTTELNAIENSYRSVIERVSDAFVALDNNWLYTYVNEKAGEILGREPKSLIGKNIWKEFPPEIGQPFYHAYHRAMEKQEYQYLEEYYAPFDKWLESHVYPSKDGLTVFFKDVTEIKRITQDIKNKEEKYRTLIEQASDGIVITDMEGFILEVNNSIQQMIGYANDEMIGYHIADFLPEEDIELHPLRINELMQGKSLLYERRLKKKDGTFLDVELNSKMASSHTLIGFIRDITERKEAEAALKKSNERFELIADATNDAIWDHDYEKNEIWGNAQWYKIYGLEPASQKIDFEIFLDRIHPDERDGINERMTAAMQHGISSLSETFRFKTENEGYRIFYDRAYIKYDGNGKPLRILGAMQDITEREYAQKAMAESEAKYRTIIAQAAEGIFIADENAFLVDVNSAGCRMSGYTLAELQKLRFQDFIPAQDLLVNPTQIDKMERGASVTNEHSLICKDGTLIEVEISAQKLLDGRYQLFVRNIAERKKAEEKLIEKEKKLQQVLSSSIDNFYVVDVNYKVILINKVAERNLEIAWGKPVKQGTNLLDVIPDHGEEPIKENFEKAFTGQSIEYELQIKKPDLPSWVMIRFTPVYDESQTVTGVSVVARDISERKQAEAVLEDSERFLKETQFIAKLGTYTLDILSGKWQSSNILNEIFGIDGSYDKDIESWESIVHPEWRETMDTYFRNEVIGKKIEFNKEYKIVRQSDNAQRWVHGIGTLKFNESGHPITMVGTIQDISDSKKADEALFQSEQKYRLLFYNNPLPMWMTTMPGLDIIDVNESAITQYGYTREEFLKMNTRNLRPAEDVANFLKEVEKMKPGVINRRAWRHQKKDGTIIHVETYSHQIMYEGKRSWLGLSHDVTDKYMAEERLQKSYQDIRQLASNLQNIREEERTSIAREIHDELGQQLTGLKMDIYWLTRKINTADNEIAVKLKESTELINATVASVRKIATNLRPSILDDLGLIAALEWQGEEFEKRSGTLVEFSNEAGDFKLKTDSITAIFRIYQELLTNVARHANATLVKVLLQKRNNSLIFSLADNGIGFDAETISQKKTLGLLGIKERTLILGGTYEFKSMPGKGSETIISIPIIQ